MDASTMTLAAPDRRSGGRGSHTRNEPDRVTAIDKTMMLYEALRSTPEALRLSDLSRRTGLPKSTTHRLLGALTSAGLVTRLGIGYIAVPRHRGPARATDQHCDLLRRLAPFVGDALIRTRCTASLAMLDGPDVAFTHRVYSHDNVPTPSDHTGRERAHLTAAGLLLLSHDLSGACAAARAWGLDEQGVACLGSELISIKRRGFAVRITPDVNCMAVTLHTAPGGPPIALTVKCRAKPTDVEGTLRHLRAITAAARDTQCGPGPAPDRVSQFRRQL